MRAIASHNGRQATDRSYRELQAGTDLMDSVVAGLTVIEDDVRELTVGFGGLPNEEGVVELDAAVMDGRTHRAGSVAGLQGVRHASRVAQRVMDQTNRVMLVGQGAQDFAVAQGFPIEDLLTQRAREMWLYWKRCRSTIDDWKSPPKGASLDVRNWFEQQFYSPVFGDLPRADGDATIEAEKTGTVHLAAINDEGEMAAGTSTSGHAFKLPGRVGDSPIVGAGLYVDRKVGTCGSIGHGEANMENCTSFACVELMRMGRSPEEATLEVLQRVVERSRPENLDDQGRATFHLMVYAMDTDGNYAGASLWNGRKIAVTDDEGTRLEACRSLYQKA